MSLKDKIIEEDKEYVLNTYKRFPLAIESGKGSKFYDYDGKEYIDFSTGIGANTFGACDDIWVEAVCKQANTVQHTSNLYYTKPMVDLAKELTKRTDMAKVFFANSGAEANECAIKAARKYSYDKYGEGRNEVITLINSFHGRTVLTLSATGQDVFHQWFYPFVEGFKHVPASDIKALDEAISEKTCAIMIETVQGEGGVVPLDKEYIKYIDKVCKEKDIIFIVDEVQTGNGRCGYLYSYMEYGVTPNIVSTAKGLAGGLPFAAILFDSKTANTLGFGQHGTTFGGNPVCAAAALSTLTRIDDKLLAHVHEARSFIEEKLKNVSEVVSISGKGLMVGVELIKGLAAADIAKACIENGLIVLTAKTKIRFLPPLNISFEDLDKGLDIFIKVLKEANK